MALFCVFYCYKFNSDEMILMNYRNKAINFIAKVSSYDAGFLLY